MFLNFFPPNLDFYFESISILNFFPATSAEVAEVCSIDRGEVHPSLLFTSLTFAMNSTYLLGVVAAVAVAVALLIMLSPPPSSAMELIRTEVLTQ